MGDGGGRPSQVNEHKTTSSDAAIVTFARVRVVRNVSRDVSGEVFTPKQTGSFGGALVRQVFPLRRELLCVCVCGGGVLG